MVSASTIPKSVGKKTEVGVIPKIGNWTSGKFLIQAVVFDRTVQPTKYHTAIKEEDRISDYAALVKG